MSPLRFRFQRSSVRTFHPARPRAFVSLVALEMCVFAYRSGTSDTGTPRQIPCVSAQLIDETRVQRASDFNRPARALACCLLHALQQHHRGRRIASLLSPFFSLAHSSGGDCLPAGQAVCYTCIRDSHLPQVHTAITCCSWSKECARTLLATCTPPNAGIRMPAAATITEDAAMFPPAARPLDHLQWHQLVKFGLAGPTTVNLHPLRPLSRPDTISESILAQEVCELAC